MNTLIDELNFIERTHERGDPPVRTQQRRAINNYMWRDDVSPEDLQVAIRWLTEEPLR